MQRYWGRENCVIEQVKLRRTLVPLKGQARKFGLQFRENED